MKVLGISAFYHDSAAALVIDGHIISAAQEERFSRVKHDARFPKHAVQYCLQSGKLRLEDLDAIVFYEKPFLKFERLLETYLAFAPRGFKSFVKSIPIWIGEKIFQKKLLNEHLKEISSGADFTGKILFSDHHLSHAASAYFPSPFDEAAVLTLDGVGEWATSSLGVGKGNQLSIQKEIRFPHSLGLLYSAFTYYCGFKVNSGEYKLMGLAPYGKPLHTQKIKDHLIDIKEDGSFWLDMDYFDYAAGLTMTSEKFHQLFGSPPRHPDEILTPFHMDLAASIQAVTEEIMIKLSRDARKVTGMKNLCLAGGVALNCVANGKILENSIFEDIWIQPAAGDAGGALGAALAVSHAVYNEKRPNQKADGMQGSYLGPEFSQAEIETRLQAVGARFQTLTFEEMISRTANAIVEQKAVGWHQGRMEYGPRALGHRSIIASAQSPEMQKLLNLKVKFRESFRPFAPSVLAEDASNWFKLNVPSPYMLLVAPVVDQRIRAMTKAEEELFGIEKLNVVRSDIPAVTHVDYSARIQTVHKETNPTYYRLIEEVKKRSGCPVLVNTSFNVRGEPIVCTPEDSFRCFMGTDLDVLVVGNNFLLKSEQDPKLIVDYKEKFELD